MRRLRILFLFIFILSFTPAYAQTPTPPAAVRSVLAEMTPEEKVGQLFLVSFNGADASAESQIANLIQRYHVGGVVLSAVNDNFSSTNTLTQTHALITNLQNLEWNNSLAETVYVPLLIGVEQEGDGYPTDQILNGLTPLPSEMAIGATWDVSYAEQVAEIRGRELSALGFNLYLGPSLDVLESPSSSGEDLGTRVFGGDPFWVGEMGKSFIKGLHEGSHNSLLVIAKHFPGVGGADRLPEVEVSTVRKSLEQLKQIEFAPFMAVTNSANMPSGAVDGLLVSHIRYQGFQGNIRATTKPISFDSQALNQIISLPEFSTWYNEGGLLISDNIGVNSVRAFYASGGNQFSARVAARDAFLAGNDIVYLGNIKADDAPDTYTTTTRVLDFFAQKYREDTAFAQRVDISVARILTAKLGLYNTFVLANVVTPQPLLTEFGSGTDVTFAVAQNSATIIEPSLQDLTSVLPQPPQPNERLVFITDAVSVKQCTECPSQPQLSMDALESAILKLYGVQSGNQIEDFRLSSYSFENLQALLDLPNENQFMLDDLLVSDWVVISIADAAKGQPALINRFLREHPEVLLNKKVILFSFGAPYYFDTTTLSKFTAYYALYSKQTQFVDVAARLLFQELTPSGASPVSIPAVNYDLISVMAPDPKQIIPLFLDLEPVSTPDSPLTPQPTQAALPLFKIGDTIALRTGTIVDVNGNTVPDGTVVQFSMNLIGEGGGIVQQVSAVTKQGVARASFGLDRPGLLEIHVTSEPALISEVVRLDVSQSGSVEVSVVTPVLTQSIEPTAEVVIEKVEDPYVSVEGYPRFSAWSVSMIMTLLIAGFVFFIASQFMPRYLALRLSLGILLGGLIAYNILVFGILGISDWLISTSLNGVTLVTLIGQGLGFVGGWLWMRGRK